MSAFLTLSILLVTFPNDALSLPQIRRKKVYTRARAHTHCCCCCQHRLCTSTPPLHHRLRCLVSFLPNSSYKPSSSRTIRLFKNGDKFFAGKVLLVPKHGNLDSFLDLVTSILADGKPVLKLFDAQTGAELLELSQIIDGDNYVAGMSRGKFRPLPYAEILDDRARAEINKTPRPPFTLPKPSTYKAPKLKKKNAVYSPGRKSPRERSKPKGLPALPISEKPRLVSLVRNGDASVEIVKLLLTKRNTADWDHLCQEISDKLQMGVSTSTTFLFNPSPPPPPPHSAF